MTHAAQLSDETFRKWKKLAMELWRAGGKPRDLIPVLGLSEEQWRCFMDMIHARHQLLQPASDTPIRIPPTTPTSYVSFVCALNLKLPGELTGDWHFRTSFFCNPGQFSAPVAGPGGWVDTTPSLGTKGVRDMGRVIAARKIKPYDGPVYVANHYRAIADMVMDDLLEGPLDCIFPPCTINDYLNEEANIERLVNEYLKPMRGQLDLTRRTAFDRWLPTVAYA